VEAWDEVYDGAPWIPPRTWVKGRDYPCDDRRAVRHRMERPSVKACDDGELGPSPRSGATDIGSMGCDPEVDGINLVMIEELSSTGRQGECRSLR
jgi:hypothetical protein